MKSQPITVSLTAALLFLACSGAAVAAQPGLIHVSVNDYGASGNRDSDVTDVSGDGRYIVFVSAADNLVPNDNNGTVDIFVRDRLLGTTTRASVSSNGTEGNSVSYHGRISVNGRFVAFISKADNLVPGDTNDCFDAFVHDRLTGKTERVSVASDATQGLPVILKDETVLDVDDVAISADGNFVAFEAGFGKLVPGDNNQLVDIFVHDRQSGATSRISLDQNGDEVSYPVCDEEGDCDTDDVDIGSEPSLSGDGRFVTYRANAKAGALFAGDTNKESDVILHDRLTGVSTIVTSAPGNQPANGESRNGVISDNGRFVAYTSWATNIVAQPALPSICDVFVFDRITGMTEVVSHGSNGALANDSSFPPDISADGRFVSFMSNATNLLPPPQVTDPTAVFLFDRTTAVMKKVSTALNGQEASGFRGLVSGDGSTVAYQSWWALLPSDTTDYLDVYAWAPPFCGNGVIDEGEQCDDADPSSPVCCQCRLDNYDACLNDYYVCYHHIVPPWVEQERPHVVVDDLFGNFSGRLGRSTDICTPAKAIGSGIPTQQGLKSYRLRAMAQSRRLQRNLRLVNQLGEVKVETTRLDSLFVPATIGSGRASSGAASGNFSCYSVVASERSAAAADTRVVASDQLGQMTTYELTTPRHLCIAAAVNDTAPADRATHLLCYAVRSGNDSTRHQRSTVATTDEYAGDASASLRRVHEICVPSTVQP